ncbi:MAG: GFA family protein [Pseudomonadota bacterium]
MFTGRCYCGATRITMAAPPEVVAYCHCADCRRWTGAPVAAFAAFGASSVTVTPDPGAWSVVPGVARRTCPVCGSPMTAAFDYLAGQIYVPLGVIDQAEALQPGLHAHADAALPWLRIDDGLPRLCGSARDDLQRAP